MHSEDWIPFLSRRCIPYKAADPIRCCEITGIRKIMHAKHTSPAISLYVGFADSENSETFTHAGSIACCLFHDENLISSLDIEAEDSAVFREAWQDLYPYREADKECTTKYGGQ